MRRLGEQLGVVPMALYKHVANKEELLDGMIDLVFSEVEFPSSGTHWKTAMRQRARSMREALLRHRWAIGLMESRTMPGPANLEHHNAVLACLRENGFSFRMALHAYSAMDSYIYGSLLQQQNLPFETPEESVELAGIMLPAAHSDAYPSLAEVVSELSKSGYDYRKEFEFGLRLVLDAIQRFDSRKRQRSGT
jgi:AcrR family transcriptional regulator